MASDSESVTLTNVVSRLIVRVAELEHQVAYMRWFLETQITPDRGAAFDMPEKKPEN